MRSREISMEAITKVLCEVLEMKGSGATPSDSHRSLGSEGYDLDSLDAATFSALLEREFGRDPYSEGVFPKTVEEVLKFYNSD